MRSAARRLRTRKTLADALSARSFARRAGSILKDQDTRTQQADPQMIQNLHYVKELGLRSQHYLEAGQTQAFAELLHEHWEHKKRRSSGMSNSQIDEWYELGRKNGAIGGKLVGGIRVRAAHVPFTRPNAAAAKAATLFSNIWGSVRSGMVPSFT